MKCPETPQLVYDAYPDRIVLASVSRASAPTEQTAHTLIIRGNEQIDAHVETLFERFESSGDVSAAIDALTIMSGLPDHFGPIPDAMIHEIARALTDNPSPHEMVECIIQAMSVPPLYQALETLIAAEMRQFGNSALGDAYCQARHEIDGVSWFDAIGELYTRLQTP